MPRDRSQEIRAELQRRQDLERALRISEQRFQALSFATATINWAADAGGQVVEDQPSWREFTGQSREAIMGSGWLEAVHPDDRGWVDAKWKRAIANRSFFEAEYQLRRADGVYRWIWVRCVPVLAPDGTICEWIAACTDITERKQTQEILEAQKARMETELERRAETIRQREALFAAFMDNNPGASFMKDEAGRIIYVNHTFETVFGIRPEELLGTVQPRWISEADWGPIRENDRKALAADRPLTFEETTTMPNGETKVWLSQKFPFRLPSGERYLGTTVLDITDMKRKEQALRESNRELERLRRLQRREFEVMVQNIKDYAIYMLDPQGLVMTWNAGAQAITGYDEAEVLGKPFMRFHVPDDVADGKAQCLLDRALAEGSVEEDGWRVRKDGSRFWAHVTVTAVRDQERHLGFVKVIRDLTEFRRVETIEQELADLAKLDRMKDDFLSVISHELRTPLNFIMGFASILDDEVAGDLNDTQHEYVKKILHGADRLLFHVNNLVEMSRLSAGKLQIQCAPTDYGAVIAHVLEAFQPLADDKRIRLESDVQVSGEVLIDGHRLTQVISNLVDNAIKFTSDDGRVTIKAYVQEDRLVTEVSDTGIGIASDDLPKLFRRFVQLDMTSTRTVGGTGLGLAICKSIVEAHGGSIGVRSDGPGKGSTFWFTLPLEREGAEG